MRRALIATSAAAVLALSAACGSDDGNVDVSGATDAVASEAQNLKEGAESAANDAAAQATGSNNGESGEGSGDGSGDGSGSGGSGTISLADGTEMEVPSGIAQKYEEIKGATDHLGAPAGEPQEVAGGQMLEFEGGTLIENPDGEAYLVQGEILKEYQSAGGPEGDLGFPTSDETPTENGFISTFENGEITFDLATEQTSVQQN